MTGKLVCADIGGDGYVMSRRGERCALQRDAINALGQKCGNPAPAGAGASSSFQCLSAPGLPTGIRDPASCGASVAALNAALQLFTFGASGDAPFSCSLEGWLKVDTDCGTAVGQLNGALTMFLGDRDFSDCTLTTQTTTPTTTTTRAATAERGGVLFAGADCSFVADPLLKAPFEAAVARTVEAACASSAPAAGCTVDVASVETVCVGHDAHAVAAFFAAEARLGPGRGRFQSVIEDAVAQGQLVVKLAVSKAFPWLPDRNLVAVGSYPAAASFHARFSAPPGAFDTSSAGDAVRAALAAAADISGVAVGRSAVSEFNGTATAVTTFTSGDVVTAAGLRQFEAAVGTLVRAAADGTLAVDLGAAGTAPLQVQLGGGGLGGAGASSNDAADDSAANTSWVDGSAGATAKTVSNPALIGGLAGAGGLVLILSVVIGVVITRSHHHTGGSNMYVADQFSLQMRSATPFGPGGLGAISEEGYMDVRGRPATGGPPVPHRPTVFGMDPMLVGGGGHYYPSESTSDWSVWGGTDEHEGPVPALRGSGGGGGGGGSVSMAGVSMDGYPPHAGIWRPAAAAATAMPTDLDLAAAALAQSVSGFT